MNPKYIKPTERFFKARGYELSEDHGCGIPDCDIRIWSYKGRGEFLEEDLPNICESITDWKKWVAEFMEEEGMYFHFMEKFVEMVAHGRPYKTYMTEITDHEILLASVKAACDYLEAK